MQHAAPYFALLLPFMLLTACERTKSVDSTQENSRSTIIAGVPVHEADYSRPKPENALNEPIAQEDR